MLRSLTLQESILAKLCQTKNWNQVQERLLSHPEEAKPSHAAFRGLGTTPLATAVRGGAPLSTIQALIRANIDSLVKVRHTRHGTALHEAIKHGANIEVILFLIDVIVKYEKELKWVDRGELKPISFEFATSKSNRGSLSSLSSGKRHHHGVAAIAPVKDDKTCSIQDENPGSPHVHNSNTLFNTTGDIGRTPLHCAIDRASRSIQTRSSTASSSSRTLSKIIKILAEAYPPAVGKKDNDGHTPLDLALMTQLTRLPSLSSSDMEVEIKLLEFIRIMVQVYPIAACSSPHSARANVYTQQLDCSNRSDTCTDINASAFILDRRQALQNVMEGNIVGHNSLSYALLYRRHFTTIQLVLEASDLLKESSAASSWFSGHLHDMDWHGYKKSSDTAPNSHGVNPSCMSIISNDHEVPLHIAVTMRASLDIVSSVLESGRDAAAISDRNGLTPICWAFFRCVVDCNISNPQDVSSNTMRTQHSKLQAVRASQRRLLPSNFAQLYETTTLVIGEAVHWKRNNNGNDNGIRLNNDGNDKNSNYCKSKILSDELMVDLWNKLSLLLPCAAEAFAKHSTNGALWTMNKSLTRQHCDFAPSNQQNKIMRWPILHAACFMSCPRAIVLLASEFSYHDLSKQDMYGNLPIHYAAARPIYRRKNISVGHMVSITLEDTTPIVVDIISRFPRGACVVNHNRQLPLHLAIDQEIKSSVSHRKRQKANDNNFGDDARARDVRTLTKIKSDIVRSPVLYLLRAYPEALDRRDGMSGLFPFMQAAVGTGSDLNLIYVLMKENPMVVNVGI